jgi:glyoxylase-like metal-dependent hydrolase (beta-lactamase superfamily II)
MKITVLDAGFLGIDQAIACFLVSGPEGRILIEAGPHSTFPHLQQALQEQGIGATGLQHLFLSHIHFDHAGAAWAFARAGARVYVHPKGLPHLAAPEKLYNSARMIYQDQMDTLWGAMEPIDETQLYAPQHGETILAAGLECTAWYTPGHAVHHIAWHIRDPHTGESALFTGDVAGVKIGSGPVAPPCPPPDIQVEDWQASIQLMRDLPVEHLYLTHFGLVTNKMAHLQELEQRLLGWARWMQPWAEKGAAAETIIPLFQEFVRHELLETGIGTAGLAQYEAANPAFMSVAGLLRYWKKKLEAPRPV